MVKFFAQTSTNQNWAKTYTDQLILPVKPNFDGKTLTLLWPNAVNKPLSLTINPDKLGALLEEMEELGFTYRWDAKITPITLQGPGLIGTDYKSGETGRFVDCSGFSRWLVYHATAASASPCLMPEGSVMQHLWADTWLKKLPGPASGHAKDGSVMIAFLKPKYDINGKEIEPGHVIVISGGVTYESFGHHGPGSREWGSEDFMSEMFLYEISAPFQAQAMAA